MSIPSIETLIARVDRLELEVHRWKRGALTVVLGTLVLLIGGADPDKSPKNIDAKSIRIFDDKGKCRAILGVAENQDEALLILMDAQETIRAGLIVPRSGRPELHFQDKNGRRRARYGLDEHDEPTLGFLDENESPRVFMNWTGLDYKSGIFFMNKKNHPACAIGLEKNGEPFTIPEDFHQDFRNDFAEPDEELLRQVRGSGKGVRNRKPEMMPFVSGAFHRAE